MPFGYVVKGMMTNLQLLIGPFEPREDAYEGNGFIASVMANLKGDRNIVRERLDEERVPQMLRAAIEAMVDVRARARKMQERDPWAIDRLRWVAAWIMKQGLEEPSAEDVRAAGLEYMPMLIAA